MLVYEKALSKQSPTCRHIKLSPCYPFPSDTGSLEANMMVWGYQLQPFLFDMRIMDYEVITTPSINPLEFKSSQFEKPRQG